MNKKINFNYKNILISAVIQIIATVICMLLFSLIMYVFKTEEKYSPLFASVALATGSFINSFYISSKKKEKGYFNGIIVGSITFIIVTVVGLIVSSGSVTLNTIFHFIIILLSSIIGGILGVNKKPKKYI